jgi:glycine/D-amino acid oxidase-like deaminating enzyme
MELTLHPLSRTCRASGRAFAEGDRVVCRLVREATGEITRHDVLATEEAAYTAPAFVFCTWTLAFKVKRVEENPGRALKLTAESLFVTLADPAAEPNEANTPMLQFLALLLERKKILRPRGLTADGTRQIFEHAKTHLTYEVPVGTLDEAFFIKIQGQLDLLVGSPKQPTEPASAPAGNTPA